MSAERRRFGLPIEDTPRSGDLRFGPVVMPRLADTHSIMQLVTGVLALLGHRWISPKQTVPNRKAQERCWSTEAFKGVWHRGHGDGLMCRPVKAPKEWVKSQERIIPTHNVF